MFKSPTSVQVDPSQDSAVAVTPGGIVPPKVIVEVCVPLIADPACDLSTFNSETSVQLLPFHVSV